MPKMSRDDNRKPVRRPCLVDLCKNEGIHLFPRNETRKAQWVQSIVHFKRELTVQKNSKICSAHFKPNDYIRTPLGVLDPNVAPRVLKKTAIPSIFPWKSAGQKPCEVPDLPSASIAPAEPSMTPENEKSLALNFPIYNSFERHPPILFVEEQPYFNIIPSDLIKDPLDVTESHLDQHQTFQEFSADDNDINIPQAFDIAEEFEIAQTENIIFQDREAQEFDVASSQSIVFQDKPTAVWKQIDKFAQTQESRVHVINNDKSIQTQNDGTQSIHYLKNNDDMIHFYTGLETFNKLMFVFHTLGQCVNNLIYFYGQPPEKVDPLDQFFITLLILRRHKTFQEIATMFGITIKSIYNIFITWIRFMSLQWKQLDLWLEKDSVIANMPLDFYDKFPATRLILDATECPINKPKLPFAQQVTFSSYKNRNTVKFLIGITPSGLINYVSPCYGGSATDRQIIERSTILNRFDYNDEIMVDKGLNVQDIFLPYGVKVNMPSFFKKGTQIGPDTLASNRKVASKRVHIERIIGSLKSYKILSQPLNQTETVLSSDIVFICAMLVNFRSNIINKNA